MWFNSKNAIWARFRGSPGQNSFLETVEGHWMKLRSSGSKRLQADSKCIFPNCIFTNWFQSIFFQTAFLQTIFYKLYFYKLYFSKVYFYKLVHSAHLPDGSHSQSQIPSSFHFLSGLQSFFSLRTKQGECEWALEIAFNSCKWVFVGWFSISS